jgi:hypothetical protein
VRNEQQTRQSPVLVVGVSAVCRRGHALTAAGLEINFLLMSLFGKAIGLSAIKVLWPILYEVNFHSAS